MSKPFIVLLTIAIVAYSPSSLRADDSPFRPRMFIELPEMVDWESWAAPSGPEIETVIASRLRWWNISNPGKLSTSCQQPEKKKIRNVELLALVNALCGELPKNKKEWLLIAGGSDQPDIAAAAGQSLARSFTADDNVDLRLSKTLYSGDFRLALGGELLRQKNYELGSGQLSLVNYLRPPINYNDENCLRKITVALSLAKRIQPIIPDPDINPLSDLNYYAGKPSSANCRAHAAIAYCQTAIWTSWIGTTVTPACRNYTSIKQGNLINYLDALLQSRWPTTAVESSVWLRFAALATVGAPSEKLEAHALAALEGYVCSTKGTLNRSQLDRLLSVLSPSNELRKIRLANLKTVRRGNGQCVPLRAATP